MSVTYSLATHDDIPAILALHTRYQVATISNVDKADGFITTAFDESQLISLINEKGLFIATNHYASSALQLNTSLQSKMSTHVNHEANNIIAYAMAASWQFWSQWPMFAHMVNQLHTLKYQGYSLSIDNSYQYGPVCVDKAYRGQGIFESLFDYALAEMAQRYPVLVTFINKINPRSFNAHVNKAKLDVIHEFEFNQNEYYELACLTHR